MLVGGGAMLLVLENSTHDTYNDILPLFYARLGWLLRKVQSICFSPCLTEIASFAD